MAYITTTDLNTYLVAKGFVDDDLESADLTRLLNTAIGEWEKLVGVTPFQAVSSIKTFDVRDIQADRRGYILDLSVPLSAAPTLVKSGVETGNVGQTMNQYDDWLLPDYSAPYNQLIFRTKPSFRLEVTAPWGYMASASIGDLVNDAIYYLATARVMEENDGKQGRVSRLKTGLIEMSMPDDSSEIFRKRARDIAKGYRLS
jgi:hypothetical protein